MKPTDEHVHVSYLLQLRKCGKQCCSCATDKTKQHGPYWYGYWRDVRGIHSFYIGSQHPSKAASV